MTKPKATIIGVTGMPGSGKSEFARFAEKLGYQTVVMGDVVRTKVIEEGFEPTPEMSRKYMIKLREDFGETAVAHLTCETIEKLKQQGILMIIIDGIRSQAEVTHFKNHLNNDFLIVAIHVDPRLRYDRLKLRGRKDAPQTEKDFRLRDEDELKLGLGETIAFSNYVIPNNNALESFREHSLSLLEELNKRVR
ncbi:MAG: AAA family ATPase [Candidatus Heimdallarchaeota archaeon]|nr:AAA family ATPase [Candidatus Heimdallarchaeota archaeon]